MVFMSYCKIEVKSETITFQIESIPEKIQNTIIKIIVQLMFITTGVFLMSTRKIEIIIIKIKFLYDNNQLWEI